MSSERNPLNNKHFYVIRNINLCVTLYVLQRISVHMRCPGICGVYLLRAEERCAFGSKYSTYLVTVEQGDQFVGYAKLPAFQCRRYRRVKGFKLLSWISP